MLPSKSAKNTHGIYSKIASRMARTRLPLGWKGHTLPTREEYTNTIVAPPMPTRIVEYIPADESMGKQIPKNLRNYLNNQKERMDIDEGRLIGWYPLKRAPLPPLVCVSNGCIVCYSLHYKIWCRLLCVSRVFCTV